MLPAVSIVKNEEKETHLKWKLVGQYTTQQIKDITCLVLMRFEKLERLRIRYP